MKILLLGANGQVGWELQRSLAPLGELRSCTRQEADLSCPGEVRKVVREFAPQVVVNAAAYTSVDLAEAEPEAAMVINAEAVGELASEVHRLQGWLVHYSTDYAFDGNKPGYYTEDDQPAPGNVYGRTKLEGERAIAHAGCRHLTLRTSWVFAARGGNFVRTILRLARDREQLQIIADQVGAPTGAELIADVTALALYRLGADQALAARASGTYHLAAAGETSWHGFARLVVAEASRLGADLKTTPERVLPIGTADYPLPARRPANSRLDTRKLRDLFGLTLPPWQTHVKRVVAELVSRGHET
jgi:dTDP-4-dehydrorhamnose reductase